MFHNTEGSEALMNGIADFPNGDKLSEFFKLYLTSFITRNSCPLLPIRVGWPFNPAPQVTSPGR